MLLLVDRSKPAGRAVQYLVSTRQDLHDAAGTEVNLLNVQRPVSGDVSVFLVKRSPREYHQERSEVALKSSWALLTAAGVAFQEHQRVQPPGQTIAEVALAQDSDLIVMGSRSLANHTAALLGLVVHSTIEHADTAVPVIK